MVTLTLDPGKLPEDCQDTAGSIRYIRECWREMRVYLARIKGGRSVQFIASLELQENGRAHLHILVNVWIDKDVLEAAWVAVGGGHQVSIKYVDIHRVRGYLAKYITKEILSQIPAGVRRFSCSKGIVIWLRSTDGTVWRELRIPIEELHGAIPSACQEKFNEFGRLVEFLAISAGGEPAFRVRPPFRMPELPAWDFGSFALEAR
jgi:hypothetical protein